MKARILSIILALSIFGPMVLAHVRSAPSQIKGTTQMGTVFVDILDVDLSHNATYLGATISVHVTLEITWDVFDFSSGYVDTLCDGNLIDRKIFYVIWQGHTIDYLNFDWNTSGVGMGSHSISAVAVGTNIDTYADGSVQILPVGNLNTEEGYATIQEAINAASDGDTIFVRNGTYYENVVVDKSLSLIGENKEATVIDGNGEYVDIVSVVANNVEFKGFTLRNCSGHYGVYVDNSENCTIENNSFVDIDQYGIYTVNADYCNIEANSFTSSEGNWGRGMQLRYSNNCTVINNQIMTHNDQYCIWLHNSNSCRIYENTLINASNSDGLMIEGSVDCTVKKNIISNCGRGIELGWWVGGEFAENSITSNYYGVDAEGFLPQYLGYPKWIFYHNNFHNNSSPYHQVYVSSGNGSWDNGCEGNYWSDYNGTDSNSDGIGDTPYIIDSNNTDNYPLMNVYWSPCDINHDLKVNIKDVARSARAFGTVPGDILWNPHADITGVVPLVPDGMVDIRDVSLVAKHFGEHYP